MFSDRKQCRVRVPFLDTAMFVLRFMYTGGTYGRTDVLTCLNRKTILVEAPAAGQT